MSSAKEASHTLVSDQLHFFLGDRFAEWLIVRLHWSPAFTALAAGLFIITNLLMAPAMGMLVTTPARRGLPNDGGWWIPGLGHPHDFWLLCVAVPGPSERRP